LLKINEDLIIEVKGSNDKPELPFKIESAKEYCKKNNKEFQLISYDEILNKIDWKYVRQYHNERNKSTRHS